LPPDLGAALSWLAREQANLVASVRQASVAGEHDIVWRLAAILWGFLYRRKSWNDWVSTHVLALESARQLDDPYGVATVLGGLAIARRELRQYDDAEKCFRGALDIWVELGDVYGQAWVANGYGNACRELGRYREAIALSLRALAAWRELGDRHGEGTTHNSLSGIYRELGRLDEALAHSDQAVAAFAEVGDRHSEAWAMNSAAIVHRDSGELMRAVELYRRALEERRLIGDDYGRAFTLHDMGDALCRLGRIGEGLRNLHMSMELFREINDPMAEDVQVKITRYQTEET